jgi:large subunit ribosomal protein L31
MDEQANFSFLSRSTAKSEETIKWTDGQEYPLIKTQISSASHPFFTGEEKIIDTEGRVDRFKARAKKAEQFKSNLKPKQPTAKPKKQPTKTQKITG